jgi:Histidine kinase-, DNA gyrase B-, and HSP90-like ATPase
MAMPEQRDQLVVRSHVARDLLQTAGLFKNERFAVWEYVVNGLQYVESGVNPLVKVTIDTRHKRITIRDNGRGMNWQGLQNFFVMHSPNRDREEGKAGRGRFGTGKCAAFGMASVLRITTVQSGRRSIVELTREEIEAMTSGDEIPVRIREKDGPTLDPNGTLVEIDQVHLRSIDQAGIIRYIERHLARWPKSASVFVNNHECEVSEPPVASERVFRPTGATRDFLGDVALTIKVSKRPLEDDERGVSIYSRGVWHETTLAGSEGREMSQYILGDLDVPKLEEDASPVSPFDVSRSMQLNRSNDMVREIFAFIQESIEQVRRELVNAERLRKATDEARKLATEAQEIAKVINEDFADFHKKVAKVRAKALGGADLDRNQPSGGSEEEDLISGGDILAAEQSPTGAPGASGEGGGGGGEPRTLQPLLQPAANGERKGKYVGGSGSKPRMRGGFQVKFDNIGAESNRAKYVSSERTIYLNLDHPQLKAGKGSGPVDDPIFRRLAYEVAFSEYSIALAMELAQLAGYYIDPTDPIYDINETLNRLARRGAHLYAAT